MSKRRKSWKEKLEDSKDLPKVEEMPEKMRRRWGEGTILIPSPKEVDELMRAVPRGKLITLDEIRKRLAERHGATITCPMTTGIFARIAAYAAEEEAAERKGISPLTGGH